MGEHHARVSDKGDEQLVLDGSQVDFIPVKCNDPGHQVDAQSSGHKARVCFIAAVQPGMAKRVSNSRLQFGGAERLGDVIVSLIVERGDLVLFLAASREHNDGNLRPFTEPPANFLPVDIRQSQVKDHEVRVCECDQLHAALAIRRIENFDIFASVSRPNELRDGGLIINDHDLDSIIQVEPPEQRHCWEG